jgi:aminopeptidase N
MFCSPPPDSARCCFPCVDACWALCTWDLRFTVLRHLTVVASGDFARSSLTADGERKVCTFKLRIPTCASNVAFAVGAFETLVDPLRPQVTSFCRRGAARRMEHVCRETAQILACFEQFLDVGFPHSSYKQVRC